MISFPSPLESELVELGRHMTWPPTPPLVERLRLPVRRGGMRWKTVLVAAAIAAALLLAIGVPQVRRAIADLLGIGGVEIRFVTELPSVSSLRGSFGREVDLEEAEQIAGFHPGLPAGLGPPSVVYVSQDRITLVYRSDGDLKVTITAFPTPLDEAILLKEVPPTARVEVVRRDDRMWHWIEGPHTVVVLDSEGEPIFDTARLAGNTLLWVQDGITYRLESGLGLDEAIAVAETVR